MWTGTRRKSAAAVYGARPPTECGTERFSGAADTRDDDGRTRSGYRRTARALFSPSRITDNEKTATNYGEKENNNKKKKKQKIKKPKKKGKA